jgi:hypothetical protein
VTGCAAVEIHRRPEATIRTRHRLNFLEGSLSGEKRLFERVRQVRERPPEARECISPGCFALRARVCLGLFKAREHVCLTASHPVKFQTEQHEAQQTTSGDQHEAHLRVCA